MSSNASDTNAQEPEANAQPALEPAPEQEPTAKTGSTPEATGQPEPALSPELAIEPTAEPSLSDEYLDSEDSLTFSNGVIEKIVAIAVRDVPGVLGMKGGFLNRVQEALGGASATKGVTVEVMPDNSVRVNIAVLIEYGAYAPQVFEDVKNAVVKQVVGMTGLEVGGVNLRIEDVLTPEEYEHMQRGRDELDEADQHEDAE